MADFSEKITGNIDKSIRTVNSKGKELLETAKLKGEVRDIEVTIQRKFNALGKKVFEMLNRGALNEEVLRKDSGEIASLFRIITELEEAIKRVELEALKIQSEVNTIICYKCSSPNKSNANFCMNCGTLLKREIEETKIEETKIDDQKFKPEVQPAVNKVALPKDEFSRKTPKTWIWIGILTVVCLIAGAGSYVYFSHQAGEKSAEINISPGPQVEKPVSPPVYKPEPAKQFAAISKDRRKIEGEINRAFREAGLNGITAVVSDSLEVTLKGSVRSNYKKDRAFEIAKTFTHKGIKRIRDMIFVVEQ